MPKVKTLYIIDLLALIAFLVCATGGYVIYFLLSGRLGFDGLEFLSLTRRNWAFIHQWAGHAFALLVITHFLMHWGWFIGTTKRFFVRPADVKKSEPES